MGWTRGKEIKKKVSPGAGQKKNRLQATLKKQITAFHTLQGSCLCFSCSYKAPPLLSERWRWFYSGVSSVDPLWVCDSNGRGLKGSRSGWKQGNVFHGSRAQYFYRHECHTSFCFFPSSSWSGSVWKGVNPLATNPHHRGKKSSHFPQLSFLENVIISLISSNFFLFYSFFDTGQKANMNYLSEVTGAKRKNSRGSEGVEAEDNHQTGTVVYFILNMQIYIQNGLHRFSGWWGTRKFDLV